MNKTIKSLVLIILTMLLGACASTGLEELPDGKFGHVKTFGDTLDRSTSFAGRYNCPRDKDGKPIYGKCTPVGSVDSVHGQTFAGQASIAVLGGTGAALINGDTARSVAEKGSCGGHGANCGTVINTQSVANALNENKVDIKVESGGRAACTANNTCGR